MRGQPSPSLAGLRVLMTADAVGGVWTYALDLARGLASREIEVTLAVLGPAPSPDERRAALSVPRLDLIETRLPLDWLADSPGAIREAGEALAALAGESGQDLVHLNSPALAAEALFGAPVVALCHSCVRTWWRAVRGETPIDPDLAWRADLVAAGYGAADALIAPSRAFARATAAAYGLAREPKVVWNGRSGSVTPLPSPLEGEGGPRVSEGRMRGTGLGNPSSVVASRRHLLPQGEKGGASPVTFVLTAGRLWDDAKGIATLDRVAARLDVPVLVAGPTDGPNGSRIEFRNLQPLGQIPSPDLAAHLAARPIFCSPALYEPFGLAVLEAAAAGCPLVLSDIATFRELWDGAAVFVPPQDEGALARTLAAVIADEPWQARLGAAARERAGRYTADRMVEGTLAVYRAVLARRGGQGAAQAGWSLAS